MTVGERLKAAIVACGYSIRKFQAAVKERGAPGASYPTVHRYLKNKSEPTAPFLREAADLLGVRYEWLAVGQGEMTEDLEQDGKRIEGVAESSAPEGWRQGAVASSMLMCREVLRSSRFCCIGPASRLSPLATIQLSWTAIRFGAT